MTSQTYDLTDTPLGVTGGGAPEAARSAVSWAAILAGAFVAGAVSLIMISLGAGLGFAAASPWHAHPSVAGFTVMTGVWLILTQWFASGVGGYLTGRTRTRWVGVHSHEVFFRDTAHGFVTWSVATVMVALLAAGAASLGAGAAIHAPAGRADEAAGPNADDADVLFRSARPDDTPSAASARREAARIITRDVAEGTGKPDDRAYLASLVSAHTGLTLQAAQARVDVTLADARQAADKARKAASATGIFTALAMLIGALIACAAAALGGLERDEHL